MSWQNNCVDCNVDTIDIGEYYMVNDDVWFQSGLGKIDGMLCVSCLENRIGRFLTHEDFPDFLINKPGTFYASPKLINTRSKP